MKKIILFGLFCFLTNCYCWNIFKKGWSLKKNLPSNLFASDITTNNYANCNPNLINTKALENYKNEYNVSKLISIVKFSAKDTSGDDYVKINSSLDKEIFLNYIKIQSDIRNNNLKNYKITPLMQASIDGDYKLIQSLLNSGHDINEKDINGMTALMFATLTNNTSCLMTLKENNASLSLKDINGNTALHLSIIFGHLNPFQFLLLDKSVINEKNNLGYTPLILSILSENTIMFVELLRNKANYNLPDSTNTSPIMHSIVKGRIGYLEGLIKIGAEINHLDNQGRNAIMIATLKNKTSCLKAVITRPDRILDLMDNNGYNAIMMAVIKNHTQCLEILIQERSYVDNVDKDGFTPLMMAVVKNNVPALTQLIKGRSNLNMREKTNGLTALMLAIINNHVDCVRVLVGARADIFKTKSYNTCDNAIMFACGYGRSKCLEILLNHAKKSKKNTDDVKEYKDFVDGVDKNDTYYKKEKSMKMDKSGFESINTNQAQSDKSNAEVHYLDQSNNMGLTPLMYTAIKGNRQCMKHLLANNLYKIDINKGCESNIDLINVTKGFSPIHLCILRNHTDCLEDLLRHGANPNNNNIFDHDPNKDDNENDDENNNIVNTPLMLACELGSLEMVKLLLDHGADLEINNKEGMTAFHYAAMKGKIDCVKYLFDYSNRNRRTDVDISNGKEILNYKNMAGATALLMAVSAGQTETVFELIKLGSNITERDKEGYNIVSLASYQGHNKLLNEIIKFYSDLDSDNKNNNKNNNNLFNAINNQDVNGRNSLMISAANGHTECVKTLIKLNSSLIYVTDNFGLNPIMYAAAKGQKECLKILLGEINMINKRVKENIEDEKKYIDIYKLSGENEDGMNCLMFAASEGHLDCVKTIIDNTIFHYKDGVELKNDGSKKTIKKGNNEYLNEQEINQIINKNLIEKKDNLGFTALMYSATKGKTNCFEYLINIGSDANVKDVNNFSCLSYATANNHFEIIKSVLYNKYLKVKNIQIDLNDTDELGGLNILMIAASKGYYKIIDLILNYYYDMKRNGNIKNDNIIPIKINEKDLRGSTALMYAAGNGHEECLNSLLNYNIKIKEINNLNEKEKNGDYDDELNLNVMEDINGFTALMLAVIENKLEAVRLLISAGANVNIYSSEGYNAFTYACIKGYKNIVITFLDFLYKDYDKEDKSENLMTPLMHASKNGHWDIIKLLLSLNQRSVRRSVLNNDLKKENNNDANDANDANENYMNIKIQVDVNKVDVNGYSSLSHACINNQESCIKRLIDAGANVNHQDFMNGLTPLMLAITNYNGNFKIIELLLEMDSDLSIKDSVDKTALDYAIKFKHQRIIALLRESAGVISEDF